MASLKGGNSAKVVLARIGAAAKSARLVRVGFLENATYPDGKPVAMVAAIHEFGKWPFFRNMIAAKQSEWGPATAKLLRANHYDANITLGQVGAAVAGQLRQAIVDTHSPPLAPSTIKRKGFDKPLIESAHMLNSVDQEVVA